MKYVYRILETVVCEGVPLLIWLVCQVARVAWHLSFARCESYADFRGKGHISQDGYMVLTFLVLTLQFGYMSFLRHWPSHWMGEISCVLFTLFGICTLIGSLVCEF